MKDNMTIKEMKERIEELKNTLKNTAEEFIQNNNIFLEEIKPITKPGGYENIISQTLDNYLKAINSMENVIIANNLILAITKNEHKRKGDKEKWVK